MNLGKLVAVLTIGTTEMLAQDLPRRLVVSIPDRKLVLIEAGKVKRVYDVAVGKAATPSPTGEFKIANRVVNPTWYGPKQTVPPGRNNPLGTRWMGLGFRGYGIHGTNAPNSIGKAASHGCIRMRIRDVEELFKLVDTGDTVEIVKEVPAEVANMIAAATATEVVLAGGGE